MSLRTEPTSQSLEKKLLILGFEVPDILAIFLLLSILNFTLGQFNYKFLLVWLPVFTFATVLRIGKRGKPDNYLVHLVKYHLRQKYFSAFQEPSNLSQVPRTRK